MFRVIKLLSITVYNIHGSYIAKLLVYITCFIAVYYIRDPEIKREYLANYDDKSINVGGENRPHKFARAYNITDIDLKPSSRRALGPDFANVD